MSTAVGMGILCARVWLAGLLAANGVAPGDRIALLSENSPNWGIAYFAIASMGAVVVPILTDFTSAQIGNIVAHARCRAIVRIEDFTIEAAGAAPILAPFELPSVSEEDLAALVPALAAVRPTIMLSVPLVMEKIYRSKVLPELAKRRLYAVPLFRRLFNLLAGLKLKRLFGGNIRFFGVGGAALAPDVEAFLAEALFPYAIGYGLTETAPLVAGSPPFRTHPRSTGPQRDDGLLRGSRSHGRGLHPRRLVPHGREHISRGDRSAHQPVPVRGRVPRLRRGRGRDGTRDAEA